MTIDMLMSTQIICNSIENDQIENVLLILEKLNCFPVEYTFDEIKIGELYDLLMRNRRKETCKEFSIFLDRNRTGSTKLVNQNVYDDKEKQLCSMVESESNDVKAILYHHEPFHEKVQLLALGAAEPLRLIASDEELCSVLTVFGLGIDELHEFSEYIQKVYQNISFDIDIENSMKKLTAGFITRRHEILYHLYCIHKEIPQIIKNYGILANQAMGDKMSIRCSPERDRNVVADLLTKKADDNQKIKCELHTKMETIGSQKPDRIYFCASVPDGVRLNGVDMSGKIYVYKITEHT